MVFFMFVILLLVVFLIFLASSLVIIVHWFRNMFFLYLLLSIEAADLLQKLSLDSQTKTLEIPEPTKKVLASTTS